MAQGHNALCTKTRSHGHNTMTRCPTNRELGHSTMPWQQQDGCKSMLPRQGCNLDVHDKKGLGMHMNHTEMHTAAHSSTPEWRLGIGGSPRKTCCTLNQRLEGLVCEWMQVAATWGVLNGWGMSQRHLKNQSWTQKRDCNWSLSTSLDCDRDCSQSRTRIGCP